MTQLADVTREARWRARARALVERYHPRRPLRRPEADEIPITVGFLPGVPRQGPIGVGYSTIYAVDHARGLSRPSSRRPRLHDPGGLRGDRRRLCGSREAHSRRFARPRHRRRGGVRESGCGWASCGRERSSASWATRRRRRPGPGPSRRSHRGRSLGDAARWTATDVTWYLDGRSIMSTPVWDSTDQPMHPSSPTGIRHGSRGPSPMRQPRTSCTPKWTGVRVWQQ